MMMNEYNYGTMDESSPYSCGDPNNYYDHEQLRLMQLQEANDFADYDQAMYDVCYYDNHQQQEYEDEYEYNGDDDAIMWDNQQGVYYDQQDNDDDDDPNEYEEEEEENHDDSALLRLIVGVQMYLGETTTTTTKDDTPLMDLQYKMYTYMKQRAFELGMDTSSLY